MKNNPQRTCIACRKKGDKRDFIRVVKTPEGNFVLDKTGKINGRGAYVCNSSECIAKCKKTHALDRAFKQEISDQIYDKLIMEQNEQN